MEKLLVPKELFQKLVDIAYCWQYHTPKICECSSLGGCELGHKTAGVMAEVEEFRAHPAPSADLGKVREAWEYFKRARGLECFSPICAKGKMDEFCAPHGMERALASLPKPLEGK